VDHIIPKNQGGADDISNLQALCFRINGGKRDTDRTDFRGVLARCGQRHEGCAFWALQGSDRVLLENELEVCIPDAHPGSKSRSLVSPQRVVADRVALRLPDSGRQAWWPRSRGGGQLSVNT
jgi:hypothetical protein